MTSICGQQSATYGYNGLGDRLTQNGVNYTLDLNTGLTQVLSDGTNTYLYGVGRIAQVNTTTEYFLGDALGSVRQLTNGQGEVTLANAYDPYGSLAQSAGSAQTSYGFTGEFTDPSGMVYLRARYYTPGDGRFQTRDTWMGDYNSPLSLNRWMYVEGNPVNYTDPSGLCGLPGEPPCPPPDRRENGVVDVPNWWLKQTQLYVDGLGYFDSGHLERGWRHADFFVTSITNLLRQKHSWRSYSSSLMLPLPRARSEPSYWVDYAVSVKITDDQINGVAYGMLIDFELGYEEYQSSRIFPYNLSGFAPADLPSDHLGFWAYVNGYEKNEIPSLLQCLGEVHVLLGGKLSGVVLDSYGIAENHEFLPMIKERFHFGTQTYTKTRNIPWPAFLEIQPIPSGPDTWQVRNRSH